MIVSREREKLIQAIVFFAQKTKYPHTMKLFKLLNFLDFEHFRQTGRSVTGLDYAAWEMGPVPPELWKEISDGPGKDFLDAISLIVEKDSVTGKVLRRDLKPKSKFNPGLFTRRELAIMDRLAEIFEEAKGDDMSYYSHFKKLPWKRVWDGGKGKGQPIPIDLALESEPLDKVDTIDPKELALRRDLLRGIG